MGYVCGEKRRCELIEKRGKGKMGRLEKYTIIVGQHLRHSEVIITTSQLDQGPWLFVLLQPQV